MPRTRLHNVECEPLVARNITHAVFPFNKKAVDHAWRKGHCWPFQPAGTIEPADDPETRISWKQA